VRTITSRQNPFIQRCRALRDSRPPESGEALLDGPHLLRAALDAKIRVLGVTFTSGARRSLEGRALARDLDAAAVTTYEVSEPLSRAISPVRAPSGIVAVAHLAPAPLDRALAGPSPLVVVVVDVQDPGNVGAIIRAAEAGHGTGVVCCGSSADPFGWKALRGSMGSALRLPVAGRVPIIDALLAARARGLRVVATSPRADTGLFDADLTGALAIVVGGEGAGLPPDAFAAADQRVAIPMQRPVESLNVAVATAVVVFEAYRQRRAAHPTPAPERSRR
jgi:TrmH family RNA methyltransferase